MSVENQEYELSRNYFKEVVKALEGDENTPEINKKVVRLLDKNIVNILKKILIPYIDADTNKIANNEFFVKLQEEVQKKVTDWNNNNPDNQVTVDLFLGGGVVRSLLAYVYNELDKTLKHQAERRENTQSTLVKLLAKGELDPNSLAMLMREEILKPEFHLKQKSIVKGMEDLYSAFVLGIGSDFDVYFETTPANHQIADEIKSTATKFINIAEEANNLRDFQDPLKHSMLPVADVKERVKQLKYSILILP